MYKKSYVLFSTIRVSELCGEIDLLTRKTYEVWSSSVVGLWSRPRSGSTPLSCLNDEKKFMPIKQFAERPAQPLLDPAQCFERFSMINKEISTDRWDSPTCVVRIEKLAMKLGISDIFDRRLLHDAVRIVVHEVCGYWVDTIYQTVSSKVITRRNRVQLTSKGFGSSKAGGRVWTHEAVNVVVIPTNAIQQADCKSALPIVTVYD